MKIPKNENDDEITHFDGMPYTVKVMGWSQTQVLCDSRSVEYTSPEAYLSLYESDNTYQKMTQDVINMPQVN
jgi:hypothetical protein